jgi:dihydrofolate synthase/folylpolyglutamate synthase
MDHEAILGNDIAEIASNKFGIISENNKVFHTQFSDERVAGKARKIAEKNNARLICAYSYTYETETEEKYPIFFIKNKYGRFRMNLSGKRAAENTSLAMTVFDHLVDNAELFFSNVKNVIWPCRMEKIRYANRDVFLSGDHNPNGIQSLSDLLKHYAYGDIHFVAGICKDKNHREMLQKLKSLDRSRLYLTETPVKTLSLKDYDDIFLKEADFASPDPIVALNTAVSNAAPEDLIVVTGSLYLTGKIKNHLSD